MTGREESVRDRVRGILEKDLALVASQDVATATVRCVLELAGGTSEADRSQSVSRKQPSAVRRIAEVSRGRLTPKRIAAVLVETAVQSVAQTDDANAVAEGAYAVLGAGARELSPRAQRARSLLRTAVTSSMDLPEELEARVFLGISGLPHPPALRAVCEALGLLATGGWVWASAAVIAYLLRIHGGQQALKLVTPIMVGVALASEGPTKTAFTRHRSFQHLLKMMLLGVKPRARSFPSGHAATSFAGAWTLGAVWPRYRPVLLGLATLVSVSRVYVGAHDPDEVLAGGLLGFFLAELLRRPTEKLLGRLHVPDPPFTA